MYGPHTCALYARAASLANSLRALTHHFLQVDKVAYKLNPGGAGYELTYGVAGVLPYIQSLSPIGDIDDAFLRIAAHEQTLLAPLIGYLRSPQAVSRGVRIVGSDEITLSRVPTVSFVVIGERAVRSPDIVAYFDKKGKVGWFRISQEIKKTMMMTFFLLTFPIYPKL